MILGINVTLGVFLLTHGGIMAIQPVAHSEHAGHLWGDVPAMLIAANGMADSACTSAHQC